MKSEKKPEIKVEKENFTENSTKIPSESTTLLEVAKNVFIPFSYF
jgi:hypothetical protein